MFFGAVSVSAEKLLIFARYPRRGKVKTRLGPCLTREGCYQLHRALLFDTLERTRKLGFDRYLYLAECSTDEAASLVAGVDAGKIHVEVQRGSNLGERMWYACTDVWKQGDRVVFIGSDTPTLPLSHIRSAFSALSRVSVVLGPARDGGYFLLGLSCPDRELFQNVLWGSSQVFQQTVAKLAGQSYELLPEWYDVDLAEDLLTLAEDLQNEFEGYPKRTRTFLAIWDPFNLKTTHLK